MFYSPELLSLRKKGKLSRCWLAGTLSDRMFKKTVSNKIVLSIDIQTTCDEILKFINSRNRNRHSRFSLYMSAKLMFGAVKLFSIQATSFQDSLLRIKAELDPIDLAPRETKKTGEIDLRDEVMTEPPPLHFGNLERADEHLLSEAHFETLGDAAFGEPLASLNFGELTEDDMNIILFNDGDIRLFASPDQYGRAIETSREQLRSPGQTTVTHNLGISDAIPAIEESANAEITKERIGTPQKRPAAAINLATPTKKPRRGLGQDIDSRAEEKLEDIAVALPADARIPPHDEFTGVPPQDGFAGVPPQDAFADISPDVETRLPDRLVEPRADVAIPHLDESTRLPPEAPVLALPAQEHTVDPRVPADSNLHLESLESEAPGTQRIRRARILRQIDVITVMPNHTIGKSLFGNPSVHTAELVRPVTDRERGMLAADLLLNPKTNRHCSRAADSSRWARKLFEDFETRTMGPFVAENDVSMSGEAIRFAESGPQTVSVEISKRHEQTTTLEASSRNKTEEAIPMDYDSIARPVVPEMAVNVSEPPMGMVLANITDEPTLANISEAQESELPPEIEIPPIPQNILDDRSEAREVDLPPEIEIPPIPENILNVTSGAGTVTYNTKMFQSDGRESVAVNEKSSSEANTGDVDAFLPPKLRTKSVGKKESQKRSSSSERIIEISDSPASNRSSHTECTWNIPELSAYLEILWHDNPIVKFEELLPTNETKRRDAAVCFYLLLQMKRNGDILLEQREANGTISISKRRTPSRMVLDEA